MSTTDTKTYDVGDSVRILATFTDPDTNDPVTPGSVTCGVRRPDGVVTSVAMAETAPGSGVFVGYFDADGEGDYTYRVASAAPDRAAARRRFRVRANPLV